MQMNSFGWGIKMGLEYFATKQQYSSSPNWWMRVVKRTGRFNLIQCTVFPIITIWYKPFDQREKSHSTTVDWMITVTFQTWTEKTFYHTYVILHSLSKLPTSVNRSRHEQFSEITKKSNKCLQLELREDNVNCANILPAIKFKLP